MKPRQREQQKQSARMYLRKHDHRDVIYQDIYHNAIWANTEDIADELVWVKYPKNALMHRVKPFCGWMDADRQFCYGMNLDGGQRNGQFYRFKDFVVYYGAYSGVSDDNCYVIEDGIVWKDITSKVTAYIPMYSNGMMYFGHDSVCYFTRNGNYRVINITQFVKDEETEEWNVIQTSHQLDCDTSWINWYTPLFAMGMTEDSIIVAKNDIDSGLNAQLFVFSIDRTGHVEMLSDPVPTVEWMPLFQNTGRYSLTQQGSRLFVTTTARHSHDAFAHWMSHVVAMMSMDGGETWTRTTIFSGSNLSDAEPGVSYPAHRISMFQRDGEVFLLYGQPCDQDGHGAKSVHLYSTYTGTQWDEIALPSWVDIPVLNVSSGQGVNPSAKDTLRIAIRPEETTDQDYDMFDLMDNNHNLDMNMDADYGNIKFQDGELKDLLDTDFYMVIGSGGLHLYFDNRYMATNSKAFAWFTTQYDVGVDGADHVIPYDYVLG